MHHAGLLIIDLQAGFAPTPELVCAIQQTAKGYPWLAMTRFINKPGSLYRTVLDWHEDGGDLVWMPDRAILLEKESYGLLSHHIERLKQCPCTEWHLCGLETDACVLACAFSLWDHGLRPVVLEHLCASPNHKAGLSVIRRQFGSAQKTKVSEDTMHEPNECDGGSCREELMDPMVITCPWPPRELSPNARCHWHKKARVAKSYRTACRLSALSAVHNAQEPSALRERVEAGEKLHLFIDFVQPDRRARDDDNVFAAFKAGIDGIAQALGIDDKHFRIHYLMTDEVVKGGAVRVRIAATA